MAWGRLRKRLGFPPHWAATTLQYCLVLLLIQVSWHELIRCTADEDCPSHGRCFKDECARCLCPEQYQVINLYSDGHLQKICQKREEEPLKIGDACGSDVRRPCPYGSYCDPFTSVCVCEDGLRPDPDNSHCRQGIYGERCTNDMPCQSNLGLRCKGKPTTCKCKASNHRPTKWTKYVLKRWDYSTVEGEPQECVARAVGEPCESDRDCADVQGSGAVCGDCRKCVCKVTDHVPEVLGTKCGPGLGLGQQCTINSVFVCDGTRGLACGDVCDLYAFDFGKKTCHCSQMHDNVNNRCIPKRIGSPCYTDLDCYPVREGYGYCDNGACAADVYSTHPGYEPYMVTRSCKEARGLDDSSDSFNTSRTHRHPNIHNDVANKEPLEVYFENITEFEFEYTTHSSSKKRGMAKSDHRTSGTLAQNCERTRINLALLTSLLFILLEIT